LHFCDWPMAWPFSEAKLSAAHPELLLIAGMFHHY
jgi:hypothetical protein